nr:ketopantoate reductase C-terminal domain-containing protein [uncultured Psychroserpens sp.]
MAPINKIGILGIGAIGTVISSYLQRNTSNSLLFYSRSKKDKLTLVSPGFTTDRVININTDVKSKQNLNWLIICLKAHQFDEAKHWFSKLISTKTKVVVIRNGLLLKEPILPFTTNSKILECIIDAPTQPTKNDGYQNFKTPIITVAKSVLASIFEMLFNASEIEILQTNDFKTSSWEKLCESAALGGILCLNNATCSLFQNKKFQQDYLCLLEECILVAKADGAQLPSYYKENMLSKLLTYPDTKGSSMLTDMRLGKPIEFEAKNGIIAKLGKYYNLSTPLNDNIINKLS